MDLEMKYIYEVYQAKSFSKAAEKLFISQSAISAMVRKAETELGCQIFDRSTIPFTLTSEGEFYIHHVKQIMALENDIKIYFKDRQDKKTGLLRIGSSSFYSAYMLTPLLSAFQKKYPGIEVQLKEGDGKELQKFFSDGAIDFIFGALSKENVQDKIQEVIFSHEYLVLAVPKTFSINQELKQYQIPSKCIQDYTFLDESIPAVPLWKFQDCPFISLTKEGSDLYQRMLKICQNAGFTPNITQYLSQIMTSYFVAAAGKGATFIRSSLLTIIKERQGLIYYKLADPLAKRPIYIIYRKERYISHAMSAFLDFCGCYTLPSQ